jgi:hypothetical protein
MNRIFVSCITTLEFLIKLLSICVNVDFKSVNESEKYSCTLTKQAWTNVTEKTNSGDMSEVNWPS